MIEIYINNQKLDITDSISITLTSSDIDWSNPTAVKSSYSKTISLPGTKTNNKIFSNLYRLDASNIFNFNTSIKNDAVILKDGILIEYGYITLDKIKIDKNIYTYDVTFYSTLGQFFYNLKYKDTESNGSDEKTLADLYYGFEINGTKLSPEEEDKRILLQWNAQFINESWHKLFDTSKPLFKHYSDKSIYTNITAAPTYSGFYDDFDNDKVLIYNPLPSTIKSRFKPKDDEKWDEKWTNSLSHSKNWMLFEMPRDIDEWEIGSLRSLYQRPAIRTKLILDAISDPVNNGGFNVEWPSSFIATDNKLPSKQLGNYYNLTWLIKDRFDFSEYKTDTEFELTLNQSQIKDNGTDNVVFDGKLTVDTTNLTQPKAQLALNINIPYPVELEKKLKNVLALRYLEDGAGHLYAEEYIYTTSIIEYTINYTDKIKRFVICDIKPDTDVEVWRSKYFPNLPVGYFNGVQFLPTVFIKNTNVKRYINETKLLLELNDLPILEELEMTITQKVLHSKSGIYTNTRDNYIWVPYYDVDNYISKGYSYVYSWDGNIDEYTRDSRYNEEIGGWEFLLSPEGTNTGRAELIEGYLSVTTRANREAPQKYGFSTNSIFAADVYLMLDNNTESNYVSLLYNTLQSYIQNINIDKKLLFQNTQSPLDYLLTFCKMLNLRFMYDKLTNTIKIVESIDYYTNNIVDISDKIDKSKSIEINPNFWDSKIYKYQLPSKDTYLEHLCKKKSGEEYCTLYYNTNNNILSGTTDVCEDWAFNTVGDYSLNSVYFDNYLGKWQNGSISPQQGSIVLKGNKVTMKLFKDDAFSTEDVDGNWNKANKIIDPIPKLCLFDKDNSSIDDSISFVFLNTCIYFNNPVKQGIIVSDNLPVMFEVNGNPCHIEHNGTINSDNTLGYISTQKDFMSTIYYIEQRVPYFSPYMFATKQSASGEWNLSDGHIPYSGNQLTISPHALTSTTFIKPQYINNSVINVDNCKFLFDYTWRNYYTDWFDKENKEVTCYVFLDNNKQISEIMRAFYYFDNCIWKLTKITDLDVIKRKPTKCTFIKVKDIKNYTTRWSNQVEE